MKRIGWGVGGSSVSAVLTSARSAMVAMALLAAMGVAGPTAALAAMQPTTDEKTPTGAGEEKTEPGGEAVEVKAGKAKSAKAVEQLAKKRSAYEKTMESIRADVRKAVDANIEKSSKSSKGDTDAMDKAEEAKKRFQATGALPAGKSRDVWKSRAGKAADELIKAFNAARAESGKDDNEALVDAIKSESEQFESQTDLVPWSGNLVEGLESGGRAIKSGTSVTIEVRDDRIDTGDGYRIDVVCERVGAGGGGEAGALAVEIPIAGEKRLKVPVVAALNGETGAAKEKTFRAMLTVREGFVGADLGVERPIDLSKATAAGGETGGAGTGPRMLALSAEGGEFEVKSVRVKPVVEGGPEKVAGKNDRKETEPKAPQGIEDVIPVGTKWSGNFINKSGTHPVMSAVVVNSKDNIISLDITTGLGAYRWSFTAQGSNLRLDSCGALEPGNPIKNIRVTGSWSENSIRVSGDWIYGNHRGVANIQLELDRVR